MQKLVSTIPSQGWWSTQCENPLHNTLSPSHTVTLNHHTKKKKLKWPTPTLQKEVPNEEEVQGIGERLRRELPHLLSGSGRGGRGAGGPKKLWSKNLAWQILCGKYCKSRGDFDLGLGLRRHPSMQGRGKSLRGGYPAKAVKHVLSVSHLPP